MIVLASGAAASGCVGTRGGAYERIDPAYAAHAHAAIHAQDSQRASPREEERLEVPPGFGEDIPADDDDWTEEPARKSVVLAETLAVFPGLFVHGLGHYYAGDYETARKIRNLGEWGYVLTALGGGIITGAYFLDKSSDDILPISLYVAGGGIATVGLGYFFTAWGFDLWDAPRAVRTGGQPWRFLKGQSGPFDF